MTISDSTTDKHFDFSLTAKDIIKSLMTRTTGNDYNSSFLHGSEVDGINFETWCTDIAATIIEIINPHLHLQSFKLSLTMDEPTSIRDNKRFF